MSSECDIALAKQAVTSNQERVVTDLSWTKIVTSENYELFKQSLGVVIPGKFDGDYDSFDQKRRESSDSEWFSYTTDEARTSFMAYFPKEAYQAWSDCMVMRGRDQLLVGAYDATASSAIIVIRWEPIESTLGPIYGMQVAVKQGATIDNGQPIALANVTPEGSGSFVGQQSFSVTRDSPTSAITVIVNGKTKTGLSVQGTCTVFPPPAPPQLKSWTFEYGAADDVTEHTPASPRARQIAISARSTDAFEEWGNPWHELEVLVEGMRAWILRAGTQSNDNPLKMPERIYDVPANRQLKVRMIHRNERTKATGLWLTIRELN